MSIFGWIRDVLGIRKDLADTEKTKLEIELLKAKKRERESIKRADFKDIVKYDRKTKKILEEILKHSLPSVLVAILWMAVGGCLVWLVYKPAQMYSERSPAQQEIEIVRISNIYFDFDKWEIKREVFSELHKLALFLKEYPDMAIEISGHTDSVGTDEYNLALSKRRADSVAKYLVSLGVDSTRLFTIGYGESKPIVSNETEEGRAQNRRVEFRILKQ